MEAEPIWTEFLRKLTRRGLRGVKLVVSDDHPGLRAAIREVLPEAVWQRCYVHYADLRIMPTMTWNSVLGAGLAAMRSA